MGVQIQPEPLPEFHQDSQSDPTDISNGTQDQTPPTNPETGQPTDTNGEDKAARYIQMLEDTLREQARQIREQGAQIQEVHDRVTAPPPAPPVDPEETRRRWYEDPRTETRSVVKELLDESIAPLRSFVEELRGQNVVQREIDNVKSDPRFSGHWDANVEATVMQAIKSMPPANINTNVVIAATIQAIGMKAAGLFGNAPASSAPPSNPNPNPNPNQPATVTNPPHMRPSAPPAPRGGSNNPQKPVLNELEKRLARERGQTDEEYVKWRDMSASDVAFADFDKPPAPKK